MTNGDPRPIMAYFFRLSPDLYPWYAALPCRRLGSEEEARPGEHVMRFSNGTPDTLVVGAYSRDALKRVYARDGARFRQTFDGWLGETFHPIEDET